MRLKRLELAGFKSFAKKTTLSFDSPIVGVVGPNGSGKSNVAEACRWVLGEQSLKSLRGRKGEDFIWHGGANIARALRANVNVVFDNSDRQFPVDAPEISIGREISRTGGNQYFLNQASIRLKDLTELLHQASLGPSGYHIITQGEADKILLADPIDRRRLVEVALGLRIYEWQISETEKKLERTEENLKQAELLRREIVPHLKFLEKEVEKIERVREWRGELKALGTEYFLNERGRLDQALTELKKNEDITVGELTRLVTAQNEVSRILAEAKTFHPDSPTDSRITKLEKEFAELVSKREGVMRQVGRLEGIIESEKRQTGNSETNIATSKVAGWFDSINKILDGVAGSENLAAWQAALAEIKKITKEVESFDQSSEKQTPASSQAKAEYTNLVAELDKLSSALTRLEIEITEAKKDFEEKRHQESEVEKKAVELRFKITEEQSKLSNLKLEKDRLGLHEADFARELGEVGVLTDRELVNEVKSARAARANLGDKERAETKRKIDRLKMMLEESGLGSSDVLGEYEEVKSREKHLESEVSDLKVTARSLEQVKNELKQKIEEEFKLGLHKINRQFQEFFELLFGGGKAVLNVESSKGEREELGMGQGLEVDINLPRKRVRGLDMLSGGERSLTSIALLFALSQVKPPPFMILDETDAALDEANSRKYGDMIEELAKETQLILVTHNRETMSRAGAIYGVTMGSDGVSRLLSIRFDEAVSYAKE